MKNVCNAAYANAKCNEKCKAKNVMQCKNAIQCKNTRQKSLGTQHRSFLFVMKIPVNYS